MYGYKALTTVHHSQVSLFVPPCNRERPCQQKQQLQQQQQEQQEPEHDPTTRINGKQLAKAKAEAKSSEAPSLSSITPENAIPRAIACMLSIS